MYAIIKTGGKQYRVEEGDFLDVELLDAEIGSSIEFKDVLFFYDGKASHIGSPYLAPIKVIGEVVGQTAGPKITSVKYIPRQNERRKFGHRQKLTCVRIQSIQSHDKKHGE